MKQEPKNESSPGRPHFSIWSLLLTATLALVASAQGGALTVSMMPSYSQSQNYANAAINESIQVWGRVSGGSGTYTTYTLDFGDGSPVASGSVNNASTTFQIGGPDFIQATHAYASGGSKTVTLTVNDSLGASASRTAVIRVLLTPTHDERVNMAIEKGLIFLYRKQVRYTTSGIQRSYWDLQNHEYGSGSTGASLMAFAENGHLANNDPVADVYADTVRRGVYHAASLGRNSAISLQSGNNPDANGNGRGIWFSPDQQSYSQSFLTMGIINAFPNAAAAQAATIPAGVWVGGGITPANFYDLVQDSLDQFSYNQADGAPKGWHYAMNTSNSSGFDGSTHQWPNICMLSAKERWGITPPAWVVNNSMAAYLYGTAVGGYYDGALGYSSSTSWRTSGKTGGALVGYYLGGKLVGTDNDANRARDFIARNWYNNNQTGCGCDGGNWFGEFYAMFAIKKGLQLQGVTTLTASDAVVHDWYKEYSAWLLGNSSLLPGTLGSSFRNSNSGFGQVADGSWFTTQWPIGTGGIGNYPSIRTAHAILILTKAVTKPLPVAVLAAVPDQSARNPAPFTLDGSGSFHQDANASIVEWLYILDAPATPDWNAPTASGVTASVNPGWNTPGVHTATLRVKDNQNPAGTAVATVNINVTLNDVPPVAVPMPPSQVPQIYTGNLGDTIVLDGTASYDVDGDPIVSYAWDLDGNGTYGTAADIALDTSGNNAAGSTASVVYTTAHNGQVGLKVCSQPRDINGNPVGSPVCGVSTKPVDVYGSASDLYVSSLSASGVVPGVSANISATLASAAGSAAFNNVIVRFYNGNPLAGGVQVGGNFTVNIPAGGSAVLTVPSLPLSGAQFVWAFVDANNAVPEYNEANNTASVNVANQPPVARCRNVTVSAGANCSAIASINDGSFDPDTGDTITATQNPAGPYSLGQTSVTLTVTDNRGASSTCTATVTVVDDTPPALTVPANMTVSTDAGQCAAVVNYAASATDNCPGVTVATSIASGTAFPKGTTTVIVTATDAAGNVTPGSFTVTVNDTEAPVLSVPANMTVSADAGQCSAVVNYAASATDNCPGVTVATSIPSGTAFPTGTTTVNVTATDASGNVTTGSFTVTVQDKELPVLTLPANITVATDAGQCSAVVNYAPSATDNCPGVSVATSIASGTAFAKGTTTVNVTATDAAGNVTTGSFTVTVNDTEVPVLSVPANITVSSDAGQCSAIVNYAASATDNCPGVTVATSIASGTAFAKGTTTVNVTATDAAGNVTTGSFTVTVNDAQAPVLTVPANITVSTDAGLCSAVVNYAPSATDNCPGVSVATSIASGTAFAKGTTTVNVTATDAAGNVTTGSFTVTVLDKELPVLSVPANITVATDPGLCSAVVNYAPSAADNCPGVGLAISIPSGTAFPKGTTTVNVTATDAAGNVTTGSFTVTVLDREVPVLNVPANITVTTDAGLCSAVVNYAPSAADNCPGVGLAISIPSGTTFPKGTTTVNAIATDAAGNTTSRDFTVTVVDAEKPVVNCPANIVASNNPGACSRSNVTFTATASDNCPGVTIAYSIAPGSTFPTGVTPVTVTTTDASGNQSSCTFTVTINPTENPGGLYPIALNVKTLAGVAPGAILADIYNGTQPGNFGWLTWAGSPSEPTVTKSLTPPGDSFTYKNPANATDNVVSVGDWVQGKSGVTDSSGVRAALDLLKTMDINVPIWDQSTGTGNNTRYHVVGFAKVRITSYQLPGQNRISARYLGAACGP